MFLTKPKIVVVLLLGAGAIAAGSDVLRHPALAGQPSEAKSAGPAEKGDCWQERAMLRGHTRAATCVAFSPDGKMIASGSEDSTVKLWDVATGKVRASLEGHTEEVSSVTFSPDGKVLASGSEGRSPPHTGVVKLWDVGTGKELTTLEGHDGYVSSVAFTPDGKVLAAGGAKAINIARVTLWDVATGKKRATLDGHTAEVDSVAFSPDGKTLATGSHDFTVKLWDWAREKEILSLDNESECFRLAFSPDGKSLATTGNKLILWDVEKGERRTTPEVRPNAIAFSPDGKTLATGMHVSGPRTGDFTEPTGAVKLWDVATGKERDNFKVEGVVLSVAFSPTDGKILAVGCRGKEKQPLSLSLNEKGEVVPEVQGDKEGSVRLWELKQKEIERK